MPKCERAPDPAAGDPVEVQRVDEQGRILDLAAAATPQEAPKLLLGGSSSPLRLLLERAEGAELAPAGDDLLHDRDTERPDQLFLQVGYAHEEAQPLHLGSSETGAEPGALEAAPEVALFAGVTEAGQPRVEPAGPEPLQEPADRLRAPDRND